MSIRISFAGFSMESAERQDHLLKENTLIDDRFEIECMLTKTATAEIYRARHLLLDKNVLLKVLTEKCKETTSFQRFQREVAALSTLSHVNIATAYATGIFQEHPYLVTEDLESNTLAELLARQNPNTGSSINELNLETKRSIVCQICDGLAHLHSQGIIHRDLRPENILISNDLQYAKLADFGFAKFSTTKNELRVTRTGELIGSASYSSPEQLSGGVVDARTDQFSLGCLIYELFAGEAPLKEGIPFAVTPEKHPATNSKLGSQLQKCVDKLLQKQPDLRYASVSEVKALITKIELGSSRFSGKTQRTLIIAGSLTILLAGGIIASRLMHPRDLPKTPTSNSNSKPQSTLSADQRFIPELHQAIKAVKQHDVETAHELASSIIVDLQTLTPTEARLKTVRTLVETMQETQFYDLEQQVCEAAADFALRGENPKRTESAFFRFSQAVSIKATDQLERSTDYFNKFLESDYARNYPNQLSVLHAKRELASVLQALVLKSPTDALTPKRKSQIEQLIKELNESPPQDKGEYRTLIELANDAHKKYLNKRLSSDTNDFRGLEAYLEMAATQLLSSHDIEAAHLRLLRVRRSPVHRGHLLNLVRLFRAIELVNKGDFEKAEPLARLSQEYFVRMPYSKTVSHELTHLQEAYAAKHLYLQEIAVIDHQMAFEERNSSKDKQDGLLECHFVRGMNLKNQKKYADAERELRMALSTEFAKKRQTDKHTLYAQFCLAEILLKMPDKKSHQEAFVILQQIEAKRQFVTADAATKQTAMNALTVINKTRGLLVDSEHKKLENSSQK